MIPERRMPGHITRFFDPIPRYQVCFLESDLPVMIPGSGEKSERVWHTGKVARKVRYIPRSFDGIRFKKTAKITWSFTCVICLRVISKWRSSCTAATAFFDSDDHSLISFASIIRWESGAWFGVNKPDVSQAQATM